MKTFEYITRRDTINWKILSQQNVVKKRFPWQHEIGWQSCVINFHLLCISCRYIDIE